MLGRRQVRGLAAGLLLTMTITGSQAAMKTQVIDYEVGDTAMQGLLVWDDAVQAPRPARPEPVD